MAKRKAPKHLSKESAGWWLVVSDDYRFDVAGLLLLTTAAEAFDRMRAAQQCIEEFGILIEDKYGQKKVNAACNVERDNRSALLACLKSLQLDLEPLGDVGRPVGS